MELPLALYPPDPTVTIRPVRLSDAAALHARCWQERPRLAVDRLLVRAGRMALQGIGLGAVALDTDGVIGYGQVALWPGGAEISDLAVWETRQGQGIGTALIQYLMRAAREMGAACVEIGAAMDNPRALALYRRLGFHDLHVLRLYVDGRDTAVQYLCIRLDSVPQVVSAQDSVLPFGN